MAEAKRERKNKRFAQLHPGLTRRDWARLKRKQRYEKIKN